MISSLLRSGHCGHAVSLMRYVLAVAFSTAQFSLCAAYASEPVVEDAVASDFAAMMQKMDDLRSVVFVGYDDDGAVYASNLVEHLNSIYGLPETVFQDAVVYSTRKSEKMARALILVLVNEQDQLHRNAAATILMRLVDGFRTTGENRSTRGDAAIDILKASAILTRLHMNQAAWQSLSSEARDSIRRTCNAVALDLRLIQRDAVNSYVEEQSREMLERMIRAAIGNLSKITTDVDVNLEVNEQGR